MVGSISTPRPVSLYAKRTLSLWLFGTLLGCAGPGIKQAGHTLDSTSRAPHPAKKNSPQTQSEGHGEPQLSEISGPLPHSTPLSRSEPLYAEIPANGRLLGEGRGVAVEGLGAGGHWAAFCQSPLAGEGGSRADERGVLKLRPELHLALGEQSEPIRALLAADPSGRFLVVLKGDLPLLIDAVEGRRTDLTPLRPDLRFDEDFEHRSFAFAGDGLVFLSTREHAAAFYLPLRESSDPGSEPAAGAFGDALLKSAIPLSFGDREVWRLSGGSRSVAAHTVAPGAAWPVPSAPNPTLRCQTPAHPFSAYGRLGAQYPDPAVETSWLLLPAGSSPLRPKQSPLGATLAPGYVMSFGDGWVRRQPTGQLLLVRGGTQKQIASERCGARILRADEASGLFLAACEEYQPAPQSSKAKKKGPPKYRFDLYLLRPGFVKPLRVDVARTGVDVHGPEESPLLALRPGTQAALLDFRKRELVVFEEGVEVLATGETQALLRRGKALSLLTRSGEQPLEGEAGPLTPLLSAHHSVALGTRVFTLGQALETFVLPGAPLALSPQGYALIPKQAGSLGAWPLGPLLLVGPPQTPEHKKADHTKAEPEALPAAAP